MTNHTLMARCHAYTLAGRTGFLFTRGSLLNPDTIGVLGTSDMSFVYQEDLGPGITEIFGVVGGKEELGYCEAWVTATVSGGASAAVIHVWIEAFAARVLDTTVGVSRTIGTIAVSAIAAKGTTVHAVSHPAYDIDDDAIVLLARLNSITGPVYMVKYNRTSGLLWSLKTPDDNHSSFPFLCRFSRGVIGWHYQDGVGPNDGRIVKFDTVHGELTYSETGWPGTSAGRQFWNELSGTVVSVRHQRTFFPDRMSDNAVSLSSVVTSLCSRVGLVTDELDVTELTDNVRGFGIARQVSLRGALELLAAAYNFDCAESDYKLRFKKRGRASSRTISESERWCRSTVRTRSTSRPGPRTSTCRCASRWATTTPSATATSRPRPSNASSPPRRPCSRPTRRRSTCRSP